MMTRERFMDWLRRVRWNYTPFLQTADGIRLNAVLWFPLLGFMFALFFAGIFLLFVVVRP